MEHMRRISFHIWKERTLRVVFLLVAIILFGSFLFIVFSSDSISAPVILKFDETRGISMFGDRADVWGIWTFGFCVIALNTIFSEFFLFRERLLSYVFLGTNVLVGILLFIVVAVITAVN